MKAERVVWAACGLLSIACGGGSTPPPIAPGSTMQQEIAGVAADDRSRCDYKGRGDREVQESVGPGAKQANIRRVYGVVGEGEDRHRVLLCREVDTNLDGVKDVVRTYNDKGEALTEVADTNFDGKIDTWITFTKGRVAKLRIDHNGDGRDDETKYYLNGKLSRAQIDTNFDGKADVWEIYDDGKLERRGVDLDFDGHVDRWDRDEIALRELEKSDSKSSSSSTSPSTSAGSVPTETSNTPADAAKTPAPSSASAPKK